MARTKVSSQKSAAEPAEPNRPRVPSDASTSTPPATSPSESAYNTLKSNFKHFFMSHGRRVAGIDPQQYNACVTFLQSDVDEFGLLPAFVGQANLLGLSTQPTENVMFQQLLDHDEEGYPTGLIFGVSDRLAREAVYRSSNA